ncbi:MAG: pilus assembly protein HicB [Acidovorax sp.]|uniref:pilus assembly protein HicB n=1 Tax=Acidovorax sp. TaxID=1872122 RepID=UPI0039E62AA1
MSHYALRLPESLKEAARRLAAEDSTTMNQFFVTAIAEKVSALETAAFFERRAATADPAKAQAAWDKVGNNPVPQEQ